VNDSRLQDENGVPTNEDTVPKTKPKPKSMIEFTLKNGE